jgi:hypothetical protein
MHFQNLGTKILNSAKDTCSEQICQNFKKQNISLHGDAILKKLKIRLNACIIILLLLYLIGVIFSVNLKFYGQNSCVNLIKEVNFSREFLIF